MTTHVENLSKSDSAASLSGDSVSRALIDFSNEAAPYYSSYPNLGRWTTDLRVTEYNRDFDSFFTSEPDSPVYLYVHIPFCAKLCYYCICNIQISNNRSRMQIFTDVLIKEIDLLKNRFKAIGVTPNVKEIHIGGGTPSHLENDQLESIFKALQGVADFSLIDEFAMEIDPRTVNHDDLKFYHQLGVDRISFGVQDFDREVQEKINRVQPYEMVRDLLSPEIRELFQGINFDILYGLPKQTRETFRKTVELTKELAPDRVTLIKYAHIPNVNKHLQMIDAEELPENSDLPRMFIDSVNALLEEGYVWAGHDHFARPGDALAKAAINKTVGRSFSGPTPGRTNSIIGVGPTTTSSFGSHYYQSVYDIQDYYKSVERDEFPIMKGFTLDEDDLVRRAVIMGLQCNQTVRFSEIEKNYGIIFQDHFRDELEQLAPMADDGFISIDSGKIEVTKLGRYFVRHICKIFDGFLKDGEVYKIHGT